MSRNFTTTSEDDETWSELESKVREENQSIWSTTSKKDSKKDGKHDGGDMVNGELDSLSDVINVSDLDGDIARGVDSDLNRDLGSVDSVAGILGSGGFSSPSGSGGFSSPSGGFSSPIAGFSHPPNPMTFAQEGSISSSSSNEEDKRVVIGNDEDKKDPKSGEGTHEMWYDPAAHGSFSDESPNAMWMPPKEPATPPLTPSWSSGSEAERKVIQTSL
jgi:hypothetical protein